MIQSSQRLAGVRDPLRIRFGAFEIKRARTADEREQIHRLNHATFVREIPQHSAPGGTRRLVDKFDDKNLYIIVRRGARVVAMVAVHDQPPFSVAQRLDDPNTLTALGDRLLEVRLLAVRPLLRRTRVVLALLWALYRYATAEGYSHLLISGVQNQRALYRRFGFEELGPAVRDGDAWFVPMALPLRNLSASMRSVAARWERQLGLTPLPHDAEPVSLMPGPVCLSDRVRAAFASRPESHRGARFVERFEHVRSRLAALARVEERPALLAGGGTLANDIIACNLAAHPALGRGLVLVNGEFGERLVRQARQVGLRFETLRWAWGRAWDLEQVEAEVTRHRPAWLWGVHCETSTGVLNDLAGLQRIADEHGARLCLDCISSFGSVEVDLRGVYLGSTASGKCLGAYPGIAIVFASPQARSAATHVPTCFDLEAHNNQHGPRHTLAWGLVSALAEALQAYRSPESARRRFDTYAELGRTVRAHVRALGVEPLSAEAVASPAVTTFRSPAGHTEEFALLCRGLGFEINASSGYLKRRGLVQIATMGAVEKRHVDALFAQVRAWLRQT